MNKKFLIAAIVILIIWGSLIYLIINYAHDLRTHPCSLCAKKIGEDFSCSVVGITRTFFSNGSVEDIFYNQSSKLNLSKWDNKK